MAYFVAVMKEASVFWKQGEKQVAVMETEAELRATAPWSSAEGIHNL